MKIFELPTPTNPAEGLQMLGALMLEEVHATTDKIQNPTVLQESARIVAEDFLDDSTIGLEGKTALFSLVANR